MPKKRLLFIYNPIAGKARIIHRLPHILNLFARNGYEITICPTQKGGDAAEAIVERRGEYELIICAGGDGTLAEVVSAMVRSRVELPLGYIPSGSTNDFGSSLQLPKRLISAAEICMNGKDFPCDVGFLNDDLFVYVAAFGLFTDVSYETGQDMKNQLGYIAYILEGAKRLSSIPSYKMEVRSEDRLITGEFIFGMISNSLSVGGFKRITGNQVQLDDGLFEVALIRKPRNPKEFNNTILSLMNRDSETESIYYFKASTIQITSKELLPWTLDGEYGGSHTNVTIQNKQKAISFRIRPDSDIR
ncbi:MAG: diacylglycerol kinase family lipid kinase [Lachnospiraceae bacterium]|jgi:YegS/Rv2252/BmrU family lipid kinase|nr:diacylglycerol kinase family lipid kinase [Lachnospiraceae bacterium]